MLPLNGLQASLFLSSPHALWDNQNMPNVHTLTLAVLWQRSAWPVVVCVPPRTTKTPPKAPGGEWGGKFSCERSLKPNCQRPCVAKARDKSERQTLEGRCLL